MTSTLRMLAGGLALLWGAASEGTAQTVPTPLPSPTGIHPVGTAVWHWIDWTRRDPDRVAEGAPREVVAQLWYPAAPAAAANLPARYPIEPGESLLGVSAARAHVPPASGVRAPLVLLCPGRGVPRYAYTALAEALASDGFAVVGVDLPGPGRMRTPDGRHVTPSPRYRMPPGLLAGPYAAVDEFFDPAVRLAAADLDFALQELERATGGGTWFAGVIDWSRQAAVGHSLGARFCGEYAGRTPEVFAYVGMEGVPPPVVRAQGIAGRVLFLIGERFPDAGMPNIRAIVPGRRNAVSIVRLTGFTHNAVTDDVVLDSASVGATLPGSDAILRLRTLVRNFLQVPVGSADVLPLPTGWGQLEHHAAPGSPPQ
jgi:pimeloyl-ACP methyl ester carboxylesterase